MAILCSAGCAPSYACTGAEAQLARIALTDLPRSTCTMLTIFGGNVKDLTPMLKEERFSDKWEPRILDHYGLTMAKFNGTVIGVERKVDAKQYE